MTKDEQMNWVNDIISFWFEELTEKDWFSFNKDVDERIIARFKTLLEGFGDDIPAIAFDNKDGAIASIILFDQMARNIYRGQAKAFSYDDKALKILDNAIEQGFDKALEEKQRRFLYMPLMHAEDKDRQIQALDVFKQFNDDYLYSFAQHHAEIIDRFGRYPHRNEVLGRNSTQDELDYLKDAERFGQ